MAKRWHSQVSSSGESGTAFDCQSLGSSLKRVRISASPGELRLERDLKHLSSSCGWTERSPRKSYEKVWRNGQDARLERHASDPLRLILTLGQHSHVTIQVPRLYPHRPPVVSRVTYPHSNGIATPHPTLSPCSRLEQVLVTVAPPSNENEESGNDNERTPRKCYGTVVYDRWSPVQCLSDLLEFVIVLLDQQSHGRRTAIQEDCTMLTENNHETHVVPSKHQTQREPEAEWLDDLHETGGDLRQGSSPRKLKEVFAPNRFDVGYEKHEKSTCAVVRSDPVRLQEYTET